MAPYDHCCGRFYVCIIILYTVDCEQNGDMSKHSFPQGLQPVSRHATAMIVTGPTFMRERLHSCIDDFPLDCADDFLSTITWLVQVISVNQKPSGI